MAPGAGRRRLAESRADARGGDPRVGRRGGGYERRVCGRGARASRSRSSTRWARATRSRPRCSPGCTAPACSAATGPRSWQTLGLQHAGRVAARRRPGSGDRLLAAGCRPAHARRSAAVAHGLTPERRGRGRRMTAPDPFRHPPPTSQGPAAQRPSASGPGAGAWLARGRVTGRERQRRGLALRAAPTAVPSPCAWPSRSPPDRRPRAGTSRAASSCSSVSAGRDRCGRCEYHCSPSA